jgi:hypothetical protein
MRFRFSMLKLICLAATCLIASEASRAAPLTAEQATELLARTFAANAKCKVLDVNETAELEQLVGMAEQSLNAKQSQAVTDRAIAKGQKIGSAVICDTTTTQAVRKVLNAARQASASLAADTKQLSEVPPLRGSVPDQQSLAATSPPETEVPEVNEPAEREAQADAELSRNIDTNISISEPIPGEAEAPRVKKPVRAAKFEVPAKKSEKPKKVVAKKAQQPERKVASSAKLQSYGQLAQFYYMKRRCQSMSRSGIASLYSKVVASHRATLRTHSVSEVAGTMRRAEQAASRSPCS